jgi:hypothetical protein
MCKTETILIIVISAGPKYTPYTGSMTQSFPPGAILCFTPPHGSVMLTFVDQRFVVQMAILLNSWGHDHLNRNKAYSRWSVK